MRKGHVRVWHVETRAVAVRCGASPPDRTCWPWGFLICSSGRHAPSHAILIKKSLAYLFIKTAQEQKRHFVLSHDCHFGLEMFCRGLTPDLGPNS